MSPPLPPGYAEVVRANHARTVGHLLALGTACQRVRDEEIRRVRRNLRAVTVEALPRFRPTGSWLLAVLVGPHGDLEAIAEWAKVLPAQDWDRLLVYYFPQTDLVQVLRPWLEAGLGSPPVFEVRDFASFHKVFGKHLNDRIWVDHS